MSNLLKKTDGKLTRDQQARRYALVMLLPALIFLACLIAYPLGKVLHDAFSHVHLINKSMTGFAGFDNFKKVVSDEHFAQAIRNTIFWTVFSVAGEYIMGMLTAVLLNQKFKGRKSNLPYVGIYSMAGSNYCCRYDMGLDVKPGFWYYQLFTFESRVDFREN